MTTYATCTWQELPCDAERAWQKVCFYEHIATPPTWVLRMALPVPHRTCGSYRSVGDVSRCQYSDGGYLTKKISAIAPGERIDFDIIEQTIRYAGRIVLKGGTIRIESLGAHACRVEMITRYELATPWLKPLRFCISEVVSAMHRVVLRDMRARLTSKSPARASASDAPQTPATHRFVGRLR